MKKLFFIILLLFLFWRIDKKWPDGSVHLTVCDVGQGDAILISKGFFQLLIDTGPDESLISCLNEDLPFWDKKIDVLVLTHFDSDHIGGFQSLLDFYSVGSIFLPLTDFKDSDVFLELREKIIALSKEGLMIKEPFLGQQIAFSLFTRGKELFNLNSSRFLVTFLAPFDLKEEEYSQLEGINAFSWQKTETRLSDPNFEKLANNISENDRSIVLLLEFGELDILLTGDLETTGEEAMIGLSLIDKVDILKVGHHGAKTSSSDMFLLKTRPETSIISSGESNSFGHPHPEVIARLKSISSRILRTDSDKSIKLVLDGKNFHLKK